MNNRIDPLLVRDLVIDITHVITSAGAASDAGDLHDVMAEYATALAAAGVFDGLSAEDARLVGVTIAWDVTQFDDAAERLRKRAAVIAAGGWRWSDAPMVAAGAFMSAAAMLEQL
ncbi:hypothetical protein [Mycolicibacterium sp. lyk4-40-TYG-92]|uniref:hypothetical protein n=1 Tax=Mycolicibacterium sp. lyk4-40-TYG-92 TaxID=3040295 RepID=UPI00254A7D75|nr:hypothetical protein [Mycolicibacterium sp. lyk4-40-TYG-92]